MKEIIKIRKHNGEKAVSARELYEYLGYDKSQWKRWYLKNIVNDEFFNEGVDYQGFDIVSSGNKTMDFALSINMAKELSMLARNENGKKARQYFIEMEKVAKQQLTKPASALDLMEMTVKQLRDHDNRMNKMEDDIKMLEAKTETRPHYFTIMGFATLHGLKVGYYDAQKLGRKASSLCKQEGWPVDKVPDIRWGKVGAYPDSILAKVFKSISLNGYEA